MTDLYNKTCFECSRLITLRYSTSFSLGIRAFSAHLHDPVYGIYGFVRYADEIADSFYGHDQDGLLRKFEEDTFDAIGRGISLNPVLHSFQIVVNRYGIGQELVTAFFASMRMDLHKRNYCEQTYRQYIYGSAEVIGLMCLRIFCEGDDARYESLRPAAMRLGAAFQKINFLRDIRSDFDDRGRLYFPGIECPRLSEREKSLIEDDIAHDLKAGLEGVRRLPQSCRGGVYIAYTYYSRLFRKIRGSSPETIFAGRVRISDKRKIWLLAHALVKNRIKAI